MKNFNKIFIGLLLGCAIPMFFSLTVGIIWFYFDRNENDVLVYVVSGFLLGLIIDFRYLKEWINHRFELPIWFITGLYLFYNIGMFGLNFEVTKPMIVIISLIGGIRLIGSEYYITKLIIRGTLKMLFIRFDR